MESILQPIKNISPKILNLFNILGVYTYWDALLHIPLRYDDLTKLTNVNDFIINEKILIEGTILSSEIIIKSNKKQLHLKLDTGIKLVNLIFFNFYANYITKYHSGAKVRAYAKLSEDKFGNISMVHPKLILVVEDETKLDKQLTPIYSSIDGLSQTMIKKVINDAFTLDIIDILPSDIINHYQLLALYDSLRILHKPTPIELANGNNLLALKRLKFDELLAQQLVMYRTFKANKIKFTKPVILKTTYVKQLLKHLDFDLTLAQKKVIKEIHQDLCSGYQMNRLLQGDVGSGKTITAVIAMLLIIENNLQACLVAPTEILARQHYDKITQLVKPLGIKTIWLSGSLTSKQKNLAKEQIKTINSSIVIGTHALLQEDVNFHNLGLAIIDEQHKFGVDQRLSLMSKGPEIHLLMMSATPIPRSLAMSYYAELDISTIDELPKGRQQIITVLVNNGRRAEILTLVADAITKGRQIYWVCPLIDESEKLNLENATKLYHELSGYFGVEIIGIVHGKIKVNDKTQTMQRFINNEIKILVATSVIEVGVDVPNASIMIIEHSERIGLSQLHQLRGRVGRGSKQSHCILLYQQPLGELARRRLNIVHKNNDGFLIANEDLLIRGPGEFLGIRQSGLPKFKFADLHKDMELLYLTKELAKDFYNSHADLAKQHVNKWFYSKDSYYKI